MASPFDIDTRSLDDLRLEPRLARYGNSQEEAAAIQARDQKIYQMVAQHEDALVHTAETVLTSGDPVVAYADELVNEVLDLYTDLEKAGPRPGAQLAARYESARKKIEKQMQRLDKVVRDAEFHAAKVSDPYKSLTDLRKKYPAIVAGRPII